jgi:hypothetical protein
MINLVVCLATIPAVLIAAFAGVGLVNGADIGAAGTGLWLIAAPVAMLAAIVAAPVAFFSTKDHWKRRGMFFVTACIVSLVLAAGVAAFRDLGMGDPEFAYIPAKAYSEALEVSAPAEAIAGQPFQVTATLKRGSWEKVRYADLGKSEYADRAHYSLERPPVELDPQAAGNVFWKSEPSTQLQAPPVAEPGTYKLQIAAPGTYEIWAEVHGAARTNSNRIKIDVRSR